jgi:outer membrane protein TolC
MISTQWFAGVLALGLLAAPLSAAAQPQAPPAQQQTKPAQAAPAQPAIPDVSGRVLSLPEVIKIALETQPQIQARLYDYAAARFRVSQAMAPLLPQLGASWTLARDRLVFGVAGISAQTFDAVTNTTARLSLSQLLFDFGKTYAATETSRRLADVAKEDVELQRDLIVLAVKEASFNLLFGKRLINVQKQAFDRAELNLRSARGFYEVGTRPKSDVTRAEVDVANARLELIRARNAERLARVALNTGMGIPVDSPTEVEDILGYLPFSVDHAQLLNEARRGRAEYRQVKLKVEAAEAAVTQQIRNFLPDVTANAFVGAATTDLLQTWEFGVSLNWSIFDGGNKIARYREATATLQSAQAQVRAVDLNIAQEVEQASLNVQEAEERIQAAKVAVESAKENFRLAQGRFDAGVGTIIELTDAQLALTRAQSTEAQALADFRIAVARLERALGRR